MSAISPLQRGRLALLVAGILWSLGGVFIKRLPAGPLAITFYRSLFAALTLLPLAAARWRFAAPIGVPKGTAKARKEANARNPAESEGIDGTTLRVHPRFTDAQFGSRFRFLSRFRSSCRSLSTLKSGRWRESTAGALAGELAVSILLFAALLVTFVAATKLTTAANAIILQYTAPIYVIGLSALLLREPPQPADWAGLVLCMAGIAVIFFGSSQPGGSVIGPALALVSGACFGLFMLWQRRLRTLDPVLLAGLNNAGAALILTAALPWIGPVSGHALLGLVVMGVVQIALPYALFTWALQHVSGPEASLLTLIEPVLNPVWVALFAGEIPGLPTMIGGALILLALILRYTIWGRSA